MDGTRDRPGEGRPANATTPRERFLRGPADRCRAALPDVLRHGSRLTRDDALLARVDLLMCCHGVGVADADLGQYLTDNAGELLVLVLGGSRGPAPDRQRAAQMLGCLARCPGPLPLSDQDLLNTCLELMHDEALPVWRAAATSLGLLAQRLPGAMKAIQAALAPTARHHRKRRGAATLGALRAHTPELAEELAMELLRRGTDPWITGALGLSIPDLVGHDVGLASRVTRLLSRAPGPAAPLNLSLVLRELWLRGDADVVQVIGEEVRRAVERWIPRDAVAMSLHWMAREALAVAGLVEAPPAFGSMAMIAAREALDGARHCTAGELIARSLDTAWAQLARILEADTSAGLEGLGRQVFEIRDLGQALFVHDLLHPALRALESHDRARAASLAGDYELLRQEARGQLIRSVADLSSVDRFRRAEVVRGLVAALDARTSQAPCLDERLEDPVDMAHRLAGFEVLIGLTQWPDRPVRKLVATGLARTLDHAVAARPDYQIQGALALLLRVPDADFLADVGRFAGGGSRALVRTAATASRGLREEPGADWTTTVAVLEDLFVQQREPPEPDRPSDPDEPAIISGARLVSALSDFSGAVEQLPRSATRGGVALYSQSDQALKALARSVPLIFSAAATGMDLIMRDLLDMGACPDELAPLRRRLARKSRVAHVLASKLERLTLRLGRALAALAEAPDTEQRRIRYERLEKLAEELTATLRGELAPVLFQPLYRALQSWRAALNAWAGSLQQDAAGGGPGEPGGPARISDFTLVEEIGKGGMGTVFKAHQASLDRFVALKLLHRQVASDPEGIERFQLEARIMGRWSHDNILRVIDFREDGEASFLVTEYVDGKSLADLMDETHFTTTRVLELCGAVARALGHAHRDGVVHRDVTPTNVLVREDGRVLLTDFGISLLLEQRRHDRGAPAFYGTPDYASPEQLCRDGVVGPSSDIYSLGVMLYELLTNEQPFSQVPTGDLPAAKRVGVMRQLPEVRPDLPADLCTFVHRMMAAEPDTRPSAEDVAATLELLARQMPRDQRLSAREFSLEARQVCVLCLSLHLEEQAVPEPQWQDQLQVSWFRIAREAVEQHGGISDRQVDHRVYGFFGARGEARADPGKALRAGRAAYRAVRRLAQVHGAPWSVRAGMALGTARVGSLDHASPAMVVTGPVVERAEALARSDRDRAPLRLDEKAHAAVYTRLAPRKVHAVEGQLGRVFFVKM